MTKRYYVTGNFSKYIPLGARRIESYSDDETVRVITFKQESVTVLIVINPTKSLKNYIAPDEGLVSVTDKNHNLAEKSCTCGDVVDILPESVTTFVFK